MNHIFGMYTVAINSVLTYGLISILRSNSLLHNCIWFNNITNKSEGWYRMKKLLLVTSFLIASLIFVNSWQIPTLKITYQNTKVEILKCPFYWVTPLRKNRTDYPAPPELAKEVSATTVEPQSFLDFSFSKKPDSFEVSLWNEKSEKYQSNSNGIVVPNMKGTYVFDVIGHWNNGQVLYVFKINVK